MLNAAIIGTNKIAGPPINPPSTSDRIVVGSNVANDTNDDDDSVAALLISTSVVGVVNNSVGIDVAFNGVDVDIDIVFAKLDTGGTKACTDDSNAAIQKKRTYDMIIFIMMKSFILLSVSFELDYE